MINGLWTVEFISTIKRYSRGILILNDNRLVGGDEGYYYSGTFDVTGGKIQATINIIKYDQNSISVFGNVDHFKLDLNGEINEYEFKAIGTIANNSPTLMNVIGTKREDL